MNWSGHRQRATTTGSGSIGSYNHNFTQGAKKLNKLTNTFCRKAIVVRNQNKGSFIFHSKIFLNIDTTKIAKNIGIIGYVVKPIDEKSFIPNLEIIFNKQEEFEELEKKYIKTNQKLEDRKKIDIAKSILMKTRNFNENEAYEYIRTLSMNKRCDMGKIANIIILSGDEDA